MKLTKIFADFNNAGRKGRVRLNCNGSLDDIQKNNMKLEEGLIILLSDYDHLETRGVVEFSQEENIWVAKIDWDNIKNLT